MTKTSDLQQRFIMLMSNEIQFCTVPRWCTKNTFVRLKKFSYVKQKNCGRNYDVSMVVTDIPVLKTNRKALKVKI